jgi:hypothetical protein
MKRILILIPAMAALAMSTYAADPAVTMDMSNGRAWNGLGAGDEKCAISLKFVYLVGLSDGLRQGAGELYTELSSKPDRQVEKYAEEIIPELLGPATFPVMIANLDEFYKDPENLDLPITHAVRYIRGRLEGKRTPQQLKEGLLRARTLVRMSKELDKLEEKH